MGPKDGSRECGCSEAARLLLRSCSLRSSMRRASLCSRLKTSSDDGRGPRAVCAPERASSCSSCARPLGPSEPPRGTDLDRALSTLRPRSVLRPRGVAAAARQLPLVCAATRWLLLPLSTLRRSCERSAVACGPARVLPRGVGGALTGGAPAPLAGFVAAATFCSGGSTGSGAGGGGGSVGSGAGGGGGGSGSSTTSASGAVGGACRLASASSRCASSRWARSSARLELMWSVSNFFALCGRLCCRQKEAAA